MYVKPFLRFKRNVKCVLIAWGLYGIGICFEIMLIVLHLKILGYEYLKLF